MTERNILSIIFVPSDCKLDRIECGSGSSDFFEINFISENDHLSCLEVSEPEFLTLSFDQLASADSEIIAKIHSNYLSSFPTDVANTLKTGLEIGLKHFMGNGASRTKIKDITDLAEAGEIPNEDRMLNGKCFARFQFEENDEIVNEEYILIK